MTDSKTDMEVVRQGAAHLAQAELTRQPTLPLTERFPALTLVEAYRIQEANVARRLGNGERIVGRKVGLTATAMQEMFGVREPDYGHILDTMMHEASEPLDLRALIDPQIEVEPAFVLGRRLAGPGIGIDDVLAATDYVYPCFEIIDSRIVDWRIRIQDTVADNGSSARVVLGANRIRPAELALGDLATTLELDGVVVAAGTTAAILGHPANGVAWLANKLAQFGIALEAGEIILPGTCTRCFRIAGHRSATGRISGLGDVSITLAS